MKKLLSLLGAISLIASSSVTVIACSDPNDNGKPPVDDRMDWTQADIEKRLEGITYVNYLEKIMLDSDTFQFDEATNQLYFYKYEIDTDLRFITNNILPDISKETPYSYDLTSALAFTKDLILPNTYEEKQKFWEQINETSWPHYDSKQRLDIYLQHSDFITGELEIYDVSVPRTLYYKILKTNYLLGAIYTNFANVLTKFQSKYNETKTKFEIKVRPQGENPVDYYFNIEVKNKNSFSWDNDNLQEGISNSQLLSQYIEEYISSIVEEYSASKLAGKIIPITFGKLEGPTSESNFYSQKGLTIENYVNYDDDFYRLYILENE